MSNLTLPRKLAALDWPLILVAVGLAIGGICAIYSATWISERADLREAHIRQAWWVGAGLAACLATSLIDYRHWLHFAWAFLALGVALLVLVLAIGVEINYAKSWILIGGQSVQPAEFTKLAFIIFLAWFLSRPHGRVRSFFTFATVCAVMALFMGLILQQPDLGSAAVFAPIAFAMMFVAGVAFRWLLLGIFSAAGGFIFAFFFLFDLYQRNRIIAFLNPDIDPRGASYHLIQSKIAIGSGGLTGKGFMEGTQNLLGFLPRDVSFSDFIFAVVGEDFGFRGAVILLAGLAFVLFSGLRAAAASRDMPGALLATGVVALLFAHIFENIGMTIGVTPITGIPLPFVSYGGSFVLTCFLGVGIIQSVRVHRRVAA